MTPPEQVGRYECTVCGARYPVYSLAEFCCAEYKDDDLTRRSLSP